MPGEHLSNFQSCLDKEDKLRQPDKVGSDTSPDKILSSWTTAFYFIFPLLLLLLPTFAPLCFPSKLLLTYSQGLFNQVFALPPPSLSLAHGAKYALKGLSVGKETCRCQPSSLYLTQGSISQVHHGKRPLPYTRMDFY